MPVTKIFAVGFPREMDEQQLAQLFAPCGDIDLLTIVRDKFSKESKGYGFVHMKTEQGAADAIRTLHGYTFGDRQLEVRLAEDKQEPTAIITKPTRYTPAGKKVDVPMKKKRPRLSR